MKFLSEEWATAVTDGLNASEEFQAAAGSIKATLQQIVTAAPDGGELHYWLKLDEGTVTMGVGDLPDADVKVTQSYETAVALATGKLSGTSAYMSGKMKVTNVMKAMGLQGALNAVAAVIKSVDCEY